MSEQINFTELAIQSHREETELRFQFEIEKYGEPARERYERWKLEQDEEDAEEREYREWRIKREQESKEPLA